MVYYLRPSKNDGDGNGNRNGYRYRASPLAGNSQEMPSGRSSMSAMSAMSSGRSSMSSTKDGDGDSLMEKLTPYLILIVLVAAVTSVVILQGFKPSESCAKFLTVTEDDGTVKVSPLKVTGLSLGVGIVVALLSFAVHSLQPSLI